MMNILCISGSGFDRERDDDTEKTGAAGLFYVWRAGILERRVRRHEGRNFNELGEKRVSNPKSFINIHNKAKKR